MTSLQVSRWCRTHHTNWLITYAHCLFPITEVVCNKALPVQQDLKARTAYNMMQHQQFDLQFAADTQAMY
jgi:hypothetical protein